jgi:hypothetical protein
MLNGWPARFGLPLVDCASTPDGAKGSVAKIRQTTVLLDESLIEAISSLAQSVERPEETTEYLKKYLALIPGILDYDKVAPGPEYEEQICKLYRSLFDIWEEVRSWGTALYLTDIRLPIQSKVNQPIRLTIQLTVNPIQSKDEEQLSPKEMTVEPTAEELKGEQIELLAFVWAKKFEIDHRSVKLTIPLGRDSNKVEFELVGREEGTWPVEIEFFHGSARIGYVVAWTKVVETDETVPEKNAPTVPYSDVSSNLFCTLQEPDVTILVHWQNDKMEYHLLIIRWTPLSRHQKYHS